MTRTRALSLLLGLAVLVACRKSSVTDGGSPAAAYSLVPMEDPAPPAVAAAPPPGTAARAPAAPGFGYTEGDDVPLEAGDDGRCPPGPSKERDVVVRLEHTGAPKPTIDLVIDSISVRKRLWPAFPRNLNPNSCYTEVLPDAFAFSCSEVMTGTTGRVYARGSDVVLGQSTTEGTTQTRFRLPCGSIARFARVTCPPRCSANDADHCDCTEHFPTWTHPPTPAPTTAPR
jgi:hypothetical protein